MLVPGSCKRPFGLALGLTLLLVMPSSAELAIEQLEQELLLLLDRARTTLGVDSLTAHAALTRLAQEHASELASRADLATSSDELNDLERRLWRLGYEPHYWRQAIVAGHLRLSTVSRTRLEPALLRDELEHVAVACSRWLHGPERTDQGLRSDPETQVVCLIMVAERQIRYQLRVAEPLRDRETVRQAVLDEVNRIRHARGLEALVRNERADMAAQAHAEDMLQRDFYDHRTPEGKGPRERATEAGFTPRGIAENIAKVVTTPEDAVARWMSSSGHRRNILLRRARQQGLGVAVGIQDGDVVALWVQLIGE